MKSDNKTIAPGIRKRGNTYELNVSAGYDGEGRHIRSIQHLQLLKESAIAKPIN